MQFLGLEDPLEEGMATHSSILAWTLQYSGLENSMDCIVYGIAKSRTRATFTFIFTFIHIKNFDQTIGTVKMNE